MADTTAQQVAHLLEELRLRLVLAESCTGGKAASLMTQVPGVSQWFCGSAVTYREQTKQQWLKVPQAVLAEFTAESSATSDAMALGILTETPEADIACSITGHLGPGVDSARDGLVYLSLAVIEEIEKPKPSSPTSNSVSTPSITARASCRLKSQSRIERQLEAAQWMLERVEDCLTDIKHSRRDGTLRRKIRPKSDAPQIE
jgi:nicotinamide-nucleotide amidase